MWFRVVFVFFCAFSASQAWRVGDLYDYAFETEVTDSTKRTNFEINGNLRLKWKTQNVLVGQIDKSEGEDITANVFSISKTPFEATFKEGLVTDLKVSPDAGKWDVEFIRGMIGQFQISETVKQSNDFSIMEESVAGKCETRYKLKKDGSAFVMLNKTKDYVNCEKVPVFERGVFGVNNWEALMKKREIIARDTKTTMWLKNKEGKLEVDQLTSVEKVKVLSENSAVEFQVLVVLTRIPAPVRMVESVENDLGDRGSEEDLVSIGGLMYKPRPQKGFCKRNNGLHRNEIDSSCETDYYMNPKYFQTPYDKSEVDIVEELVAQIADGLKNPSEVPKTNTLDRFTNLVAAVRRINLREMEEVSHLWKSSTTEAFILQSAVTQAGTLDSLLMIKNWKKMDQLTIPVRILPNIIQPLSLEYLDTLFDFATDPELMEKDFDFAKDLILVFSNTLRRYMTEKEKPFEMEQLNRLILKKYRRYFKERLEESLNNKDDLKLQVYVKAIGNMADLSLFNYFLSLSPEKLTPFQKTLVVNSMDEIVRMYPAKSQVMLMKMYNDDESISVRIAAGYKLLNAKLDEKTVRHMINTAKESENADLQNAIKSAVLSEAHDYRLNKELSELAETIEPENIDTATKSKRLSEHIFKDYSDNKTTMHIIYEYIQGLDQNPLSMFVHGESDRKGFKSSVKYGGMIDNFQDYVKSFVTSPNTRQRYPYAFSFYEKIKPKLSSANLEIDWDFEQFFEPFENLASSPEQFLKFFSEDRRTERKSLTMDEVSIGFPTEIGFPFLYSYESPELLFFEGAIRNEGSIRFDVNFVWSDRQQTKMGVVNPFNGKYYVVGSDVNKQVYIPLTISYEANNNFVVTIDPLFREGNQRILHFGTWPYTGIRDLYPVEPVAEDKNTKNIVPADLNDFDEYADDSKRFRMKIVSSSNVDDYFDKDFELYEFEGPFGEVLPTYNIFNIFFKEDETAPTSLIFKLDISKGEVKVESQSKPMGSMKGPYLFMGRNVFDSSIELTGPTNRSVSLTGKTFSDLLSQTLKFSLEGAYSENAKQVYQGCYDMLIGQKKNPVLVLSEEDEDDKNKMTVFQQFKFGETCDSGAYVNFETDINPDDLKKGGDIEIKLTLDFNGLPDEIATELCKLKTESVPGADRSMKVEFVQKNTEKCRELIENAEDREMFVDESTTEFSDLIEVMWDQDRLE